MTTESSLSLTKRLEGAGFRPEQAREIMLAMEEILGTPLTKDVFQAELRAHTAAIETHLAQLNGGMKLLTAEMATFREAIQAGQDSFKREAELKEAAFEQRINASIARGRLATYGGLMVLIAGVLTLLARSFGLTFPIQ